MLTDLLDEDQAGIAETLPNMVYTRDVCMVSKLGAHSLRMTYAARQVEPFLIDKPMERLGVPVAQRITPPALVEGGDFVWLNEEARTEEVPGHPEWHRRRHYRIVQGKENLMDEWTNPQKVWKLKRYGYYKGKSGHE